MSTNDNDVVGYCRPPKRTQWKKGQSGNPRNKNRAGKRTKVLSRIVEDIFSEELDVLEDGVGRRITVFEAILLQLWLKQSKGNRRAMRVLRKYEAFAKKRPEYYVVTEQDRKEAAELYAQRLREGHSGSQREESWRNLSAKEAAERYHAVLDEMNKRSNNG